jgi:UDP-N-acetylmuramate dehydrogenase
VTGDSTAAAPSWSPAGAAAVAADLRVRLGVRVRLDEPLAPHTTMRVGGPADLLAVAHDVAELAEIVRFARSGAIPYVVLGRGSDLVVSDLGIRGMVVLCRAEGHRIEGELLVADAGLPMARAAMLGQRAGLAGLEFGLAIPGTVGGAIWANAGAHGADVAAVLQSATILRADGTEAFETASDLGLAYRDSRLKQAPAGGAPTAGLAARSAGLAARSAAPSGTSDLVLAATFRLSPESPAIIKGRLDEIRRWRREHQPIGLASAGSVFRNPDGDSAGRLIDACGLKGRRVGGAAISDKHANFIINDRGATAADVRHLAEVARAAVATRFGIELVYEVQFVGDWPDWQLEAK